MKMHFLKDSQLVRELNDNRRLQWLLLACLIILALSLSKKMIDIVSEDAFEVQRQANLLARLESAGDNVLTEDARQTLLAEYKAALTSIPVVSSSGVAEAQALSVNDMRIGHIVNKPRTNLIGVERLQRGDEVFFQVRIETAGRLDESQFIGLLSVFDENADSFRLVSFQFKPNASNAVSIVGDYLYRKSKQ
ncbi:hypothetical protein D210916BOD24_27220 [Alteromonas sp. D210916BOD_24]|uniref:hypothetical protein n=1 Tax=Alteromonas sp. D210916BOD_24 TaxID=3157618 RepID=UPI00399CF79D